MMSGEAQYPCFGLPVLLNEMAIPMVKQMFDTGF